MVDGGWNEHFGVHKLGFILFPLAFIGSLIIHNTDMVIVFSIIILYCTGCWLTDFDNFNKYERHNNFNKKHNSQANSTVIRQTSIFKEYILYTWKF